MDIDRAFLADIVAAPDDDGVRLIYADWLDDHGRHARAEFIRLQIGSSRPADPGRERELLAAHRDEWFAPFLPALLVEAEVRPWNRRETMHVFRRGFLEAAALEIDRFAESAAALFDAEPVRDVWIPYTDDRGVATLAESPYLSRMRTLDLSAGFYEENLDLILGSPRLASLEVLRLCPAGDQWGVGRSAVEALAENAALVGLREIVWDYNVGRPGDDLVAVLSRAPWLAGLTHLCLRCVGLGDAGARTIASCPELSGLRVLDLSENVIGEAGLIALAESPHLGRLERLLLVDHHGDNHERTMSRLRERFGDRLVT